MNMQKYIIEGGNRLFGEVDISGAKNSSLPILAATLITSGDCVLHNCPNLSDVDATLNILNHLGCKTKREKDTITVSPKNADTCEIPDKMMREMRSSIIFLGALITRFGCAKMSLPGGCELGPRPIDIHLDALSKMGVSVNLNHGTLECCAENGLKGAKIHLSFPSVGATENVLITATLAQGITEISNCAREPEIVDLANFLRKSGAKIKGDGTDFITVEGVQKLLGCEHTILSDRIESATFLAIAAATKSELTLNQTNPEDMKATLDFFYESGCKIKIYDKTKLLITPPERLSRVKKVITMPYPGFPTDVQAIAMAVTTLSHGTSIFVENIFENRYRHAGELNRMGANIKTHGKVAVVEGVKTLHAAVVESTDLRGGASLAVAALSAEGISEITHIHHIDRGYSDFKQKLQKIGAKIERHEYE